MSNSAAGVFVTGTDTDVGKTVTAACLVAAWQAAYWKPVQTGLASDPGDTATVKVLAELPPDRVLAPVYAFAQPLSPHAAAAAEGATISMATLAPPRCSRPLVVEGAGGVLVPLNDTQLIIDLMVQLRLPVVLVARSTLGTINHTLLTLEALRARKLDIAGVVLNGHPDPGNRDAIARYGKVRILAELPRQSRIDRTAIRDMAARIPPLATVLP
jgi:dethiobiotin synthase